MQFSLHQLSASTWSSVLPSKQYIGHIHQVWLMERQMQSLIPFYIKIYPFQFWFCYTFLVVNPWPLSSMVFQNKESGILPSATRVLGSLTVNRHKIIIDVILQHLAFKPSLWIEKLYQNNHICVWTISSSFFWRALWYCTLKRWGNHLEGGCCFL